nr:hypothetical protein [Tanacetum cinerariifolium]
MRLQYEALTRSVWLLYAATDLQVETLASPLTLETEHAARKMPMLSDQLKQIQQKAPEQAARMLLNFKEVSYHAMNSFVHSGIHPLRRHAEGYPATLVEDVKEHMMDRAYEVMIQWMHVYYDIPEEEEIDENYPDFERMATSYNEMIEYQEEQLELKW